MSKETLEELCIRLEHFETPLWAAYEVLQHEILTPQVVDPCCGAGVLSELAAALGHFVQPFDVHDWGFSRKKIKRVQNFVKIDFLSLTKETFKQANDFSILMNPPFSLAEKFVEKCFDLGARKIVCFQRFAWWESQGREEFWNNYPPNRIYICGSRATCWRHDIPINAKGRRYNPKTGKEMAGTSTAHAFFIWEKGHPPGTLVGRIYNRDE